MYLEIGKKMLMWSVVFFLFSRFFPSSPFVTMEAGKAYKIALVVF